MNIPLFYRLLTIFRPYIQSLFNLSYYSIVDLQNRLGVDGEKIYIDSFYAKGLYPESQRGAWRLVYKSTQAKSSHNGITVHSPTVPWDGTQAGLAAYQAKTGETDTSGYGCWVFEYNELSPEMAGAVGYTSGDDTVPINSLLALLDDGDSVKFGEKYKVTSQSVFPSKKVSYSGRGPIQTKLVYAGANTTNDCFVFGDGTNAINGLYMSGISFESDTLMTDGAGVRFKGLTRSILENVYAGHQDSNTNFYHGMWFDELDQVSLTSYQAKGQLDGIRVNGGSKGRANLFLNNGKVMKCTNGLHVGGDFGGLYIDGSDIICNGTNILIDKAIVNTANREIILGPGCYLDSASTTGDCSIKDGINLDIQDTGGSFFLNHTWCASAGTLIRTGASFTGQLTLNSPYLLNALTTYGGNGNAIEIGNVNALVQVNNPNFRTINGYCVTSTAGASTNIFISDPVFISGITNTFNNVSANTSTYTHKSSSQAIWGRLAAGHTENIGAAVDGSPVATVAIGGSLGSAFNIPQYKNSAAAGWLEISKSRSDTVGTHTILTANDAIGGINFAGSDGSAFVSGARIRAVNAGAAPSSGKMPATLEFYNSDASGNLTLRLSARYDGAILPGADNAQSLGGGSFRWTNMYTVSLNATGSPTIHSGTAIPAGGTAGAGYLLSSTANFGVFFGSGVPLLSAAKGSLYLRSDGSGVGDRMYINTDGGTTWTAVTTVA